MPQTVLVITNHATVYEKPVVQEFSTTEDFAAIFPRVDIFSQRLDSVRFNYCTQPCWMHLGYVL